MPTNGAEHQTNGSLSVPSRSLTDNSHGTTLLVNSVQSTALTVVEQNADGGSDNREAQVRQSLYRSPLGVLRRSYL